MYLPRLFVYHADAEKGSVQSETFKLMERRLYRGITTPAMVLTWIFGLWHGFRFGVVDWSLGWTWLKAVMVIALSGYPRALWPAIAGVCRGPQRQAGEILPDDQRDSDASMIAIVIVHRRSIVSRNHSVSATDLES